VVPGRLEEVNNYEGFKIFIDYAHTPDALENVLQTLKNINGIKRIITVF
jgi:UDP-N-acetylmuramoyl-L-alanyl-D-glutamate--2,6-diaminopimelate ligase